MHVLSVSLPACLPAVRPVSGGRIGPVFPHNSEYWHTNTDLLFWLRFIHYIIVSSFILHCFSSLWLVNEKVRNYWRDVNELYGLNLLSHASGQMHMYLIASSVKIITKCYVFTMYRFKSASHIETYMHVLGLWYGCC